MKMLLRQCFSNGRQEYCELPARNKFSLPGEEREKENVAPSDGEKAADAIANWKIWYALQ